MGEFQKRLKSLREACGYTQEGLAKRIDISRSAIGMYESGSREPDRETLEKIADFFNVDMNYLYGRSSTITTLPESVLTIDERTLLEKFRRLDSYDRGYITGQIDLMLEKKTNRMESDVSVS